MRCTVPNPGWKYKTFHDHYTRWRGGTAVGRGHRGARATAATPPVLVAPLSHDPDVAWRVNGLAAKERPRMGSSHRVREKPPARRPRVVVEEPAQSRPAPAAASGARWDRLAYQDPSLRPP